MEDSARRRQRLKNEWQRAARDKTRTLLAQLDGMLTDSQAQTSGAKPMPRPGTEARGERQVLEAVCKKLRQAIWTPPSAISEGLAVSQAHVFAVVKSPSLAIVATGVPFFRLFASISPAASLADLVHPEDLVQLRIAATALTHAPAAIEAQRAIMVRMRVCGGAGWVNFRLTLAEGTRGKTLGVWFAPAASPAPTHNLRDSERAAFAAQGAAQRLQDLQQHSLRLGAHCGSSDPASASRTTEHADLLSSRTIDAIEVCNANSTIVAASPALCRRLRFVPGELEGQSLLHLVHPRNAFCAFDFICQNNRAPEALELPDMLVGSCAGRKRGAGGQAISGPRSDSGGSSSTGDSGGSNSTGDRACTSSGTNDSGGSSDMNDGSKQGSTPQASCHLSVNSSQDGSCRMGSNSQGSVSSVESAGESSGEDNSSPDCVPDRASDSGNSSGSDGDSCNHDSSSNDGSCGGTEEGAACSFENSDAMSSTSSNLGLEREALAMTYAVSTPEHDLGSVALPAAVRCYLERQRAAQRHGINLELVCCGKRIEEATNVKHMVMMPRRLVCAGASGVPGRSVFILEKTTEGLDGVGCAFRGAGAREAYQATVEGLPCRHTCGKYELQRLRGPQMQICATG